MSEFIGKESIVRFWGNSQVALVVKNSPANVGDLGSIPGLGRFGGGSGNPLQYSCLENPHGDRGAWQAIVHRVAKSWTQLSLHMHTSM